MKTASEIIRGLEMRVARLEKQAKRAPMPSFDYAKGPSARGAEWNSTPARLRTYAKELIDAKVLNPREAARVWKDEERLTALILKVNPALEGMARKAGAEDKILGDELVLYIVNESVLYRKAKAIIANQAKHMMKGRWNRAGGVKGFLHLVNDGVQSYRKEFGLPAVDKATKEYVAGNLLDHYMEEIEDEAGL